MGLAAALAVVVSVVTLFLTAHTDRGEAIGVVALLAFSIALWAALRRRCPPAILRLIMLGLLLRASASLVQAFVVGLPESGVDALRFEAEGWLRFQGGLSSILQGIFQEHTDIFGSLIGLAYWIVGARSPLLIQAINVVLGTLVVANVFKISTILGGQRTATRATAIAAAFPTLVLYSALVLREAPVAFFVSYSALATVRWVVSGRLRHVLVAIGAAVCGALFHSGALALLPAILIVGLTTRPGELPALRGSRNPAPRALLSRVTVTVAVALAFTAVVALGIGTQKLQPANLDIAMSADYGGGGAQYLAGWSANSLLEMAGQMPVRLLYFVASPFPWQVRTPGHFVGLADSLLYVGVLMLLASNSRLVWHDRRLRALVVLSACMLTVFAAGTLNFGTALRHRAKVAPLLVPLVVAVLGSRNRGEAPTPRPGAAPLLSRPGLPRLVDSTTSSDPGEEPAGSPPSEARAGIPRSGQLPLGPSDHQYAD